MSTQRAPEASRSFPSLASRSEPVSRNIAETQYKKEGESVRTMWNGLANVLSVNIGSNTDALVENPCKKISEG